MELQEKEAKQEEPEPTVPGAEAGTFKAMMALAKKESTVERARELARPVPAHVPHATEKQAP